MIMIITLWLLRRRPPLRERALVCPSVFNSCLSQETDRRRRLRSVCPDRQELNVAESSNLMHRCLITTDVCCAILSWQCHKKRSRQGSCHNAQAQNVSYFIFMAIDSSNLVICCALTRYAKRSKDMVTTFSTSGMKRSITEEWIFVRFSNFAEIQSD